MNKFKHSGTFGDIIYSLAVVKYLGGGEFYLHLDQITWLTQHHYGSQPNPFHRGRMNRQDLDSLRPLLEQQSYISKYAELDPRETEITHNLDRFRDLFKTHPGNYVDIYAETFRIPKYQWAELRNTPWLTVDNPRPIEGRPVVINRTQRWQSTSARQSWDQIKAQGAEQEAIFIGLESEYLDFKQEMGWDLPYHSTETLLDMAEVIAGADQFIGNQSVALSLAIGLGREFAVETRSDLPLERNECWFPEHPKGDYF